MAWSIKDSIRVLDANSQKLASDFSCGNPHLDMFIRSYLAQDLKYGKTYAWITDDGNAMIGFYNIAAGSVDQVDAYIRTKMGGAIHINDFAVDSRYQGVEVGPGMHFSDILLADCIERCRHIRDQYIGSTFITLQATNAGLKLYKRNGFFELEDDMRVTQIVDKEYGCTPMYLPMDLE